MATDISSGIHDKSPVYKMTVDLNVLEHLGMNLYSNISAVLTEAVANAWDADAKEVKIKIDVEDDHDLIEISDDGIGMTVRDMNEKYLRVGHRGLIQPQAGVLSWGARDSASCPCFPLPTK